MAAITLKANSSPRAYLGAHDLTLCNSYPAVVTSLATLSSKCRVPCTLLTAAFLATGSNEHVLVTHPYITPLISFVTLLTEVFAHVSIYMTATSSLHRSKRLETSSVWLSVTAQSKI